MRWSEYGQKKLALSRSISHQDRMIDWVEIQPLSDEPSESDMEKAIKENWSGLYCALCNLYFTCKNCPLNISGQNCFDDDSLYSLMNQSKDWEHWLYYARKLRIILQRLYEKLDCWG